MKKIKITFTLVLLLCVIGGAYVYLSKNLTKSGTRIFKDCSPAVVQIRTDVGTGSGFLIDKKGIVVTNYHVVGLVAGKNSNVIVTLQNGEEYRPVSVIDHHPIKDLCILKIQAPHSLPFIPLGDENAIDVGARAYTIGNPLGLNYVISDGIISRIAGEYYRRMIQFTCPISPGNSGGPLLDDHGRVIGIVTEFLYPTDGTSAQNLNFAITISEVKNLLKDPHEIDLSDFLEMTTHHSEFFTKVNSAYSQKTMEGTFSAFQSMIDNNCDDLNRRDCFFVYMEMIRLSMAIYNQLNGQLEPDPSPEKLNSLPREKLTSMMNAAYAAVGWSDTNIDLVHEAGGWKVIADKYHQNFHPPQNDFEIVMDESVCAGLRVKALGAYTIDRAVKYYEEYKQCAPNSPLLKFVGDEIAQKPAAHTKDEIHQDPIFNRESLSDEKWKNYKAKEGPFKKECEALIAAKNFEALLKVAKKNAREKDDADSYYYVAVGYEGIGNSNQSQEILKKVRFLRLEGK